MRYAGRQRLGRGAPIAAAVCAAAGVFCAFVYTPMRFSGYLFLAAAVYFLAWFALGLLGGRPGRALRFVLLALLIAGLALFAVLEFRVVSYGHTDRETKVAAVVILGAGVNGSEPSLSLQSRLEAALAYVADKPDIPIVVTGSQGPGEDLPEGQCMAQWLEEHGIAPERILIDTQADNTEENIRYSKALLARQGLDETAQVAVVTADYHLYRTSLYWNADTMVPVAAHMPPGYWLLDVNYYIREAFAVAAFMIL